MRWCISVCCGVFLCYHVFSVCSAVLRFAMLFFRLLSCFFSQLWRSSVCCGAFRFAVLFFGLLWCFSLWSALLFFGLLCLCFWPSVGFSSGLLAERAVLWSSRQKTPQQTEEQGSRQKHHSKPKKQESRPERNNTTAERNHHSKPKNKIPQQKEQHHSRQKNTTANRKTGDTDRRPDSVTA